MNILAPKIGALHRDPIYKTVLSAKIALTVLIKHSINDTISAV
jgi:hypothetical protein